MRKVKFELYGSEKQGYFVGIAGVVSKPSGFGDALLIVEDEDGKVYSVKAEDVQFTSKPITETHDVSNVEVLDKVLWWCDNQIKVCEDHPAYPDEVLSAIVAQFQSMKNNFYMMAKTTIPK